MNRNTFALTCAALITAASLCCTAQNAPAPEGLRAAVFDVNATPPVGSMMAYDKAIGQYDLTLRARGVVVLGAGTPIVVCAVDWICIANGSNEAFRKALAAAALTTPDRVAVHTVHQHDAPFSDFSAEKLLEDRGFDAGCYEGGYQHDILAALAGAVAKSVQTAQPVTHMGLGAAQVLEVASNRRVRGPDGKVRGVRWSTTLDAALRAEPEGLIDPMVSLISLWNGDKPIAVLSYYACHPQSYYRTGIPNPDYPGIARFLRQLAVPDALHIHFDGAGGNVTAGKYNDGNHENRRLFAERLADGMKRAWDATEKFPIAPADVSWNVAQVNLPLAAHLDAAQLETQFNAARTADEAQKYVSDLVWARRCRDGQGIGLACLGLGRARVLFMSGELFVEYQLAAKAMRPDLFVAMAAYGDCAPGYIGTAVAYGEGGYETTPPASGVKPEVEGVLMEAMRTLLGSHP